MFTRSEKMGGASIREGASIRINAVNPRFASEHIINSISGDGIK